MELSENRQNANAPEMGTNAPNLGAIWDRAPLAEALFGKTRGLVLGLFFTHPNEDFYMRQLARILGLGQGALQRELRRFTEAGILLRESRGRQVHYRVNRECPIYADLQGLILKTIGLADVLRSALAPLAKRIEAAFVYGSMAKATLTEHSDVDVMVIGEASFGEVVAALNPTQDILRREVNPSVYSVDEFQHRMKDSHHFLTAVLEGPKLFLIGGEGDLGRLVEERLADQTAARAL